MKPGIGAKGVVFGLNLDPGHGASSARCHKRSISNPGWAEPT
jgi:hypothetical protein